MRMFNPPHPGELLKEWLNGEDVSAFAERIGVARSTLSRILHGHAGISAGMALTLSEAFKTSPEVWMNLQVQYDLWHAIQARKAARRAAKAISTAVPKPAKTSRAKLPQRQSRLGKAA